MRAKRFLLMLFVFIFTFAMLVCFTACEDDAKADVGSNEESTESSKQNESSESGEEHLHSFSEWKITEAATCTLQGIQTRICACGVSEYSPIAATGHTEVTDAAVSVTCTADGKTAGKHCSVCNAVLVAQTTIPSLGHQYNGGEIETAASCSRDGVKKFTCTIPNCGHSYTEEYALPTYTASEIYETSIKYVGEIITYNKSGAKLALGTGFVLSSDGKIVTNYHVIDGAYSADITIDGKKYQILSVLAYNADSDLAVLKINASGLTAATVCTKPMSVGSVVYAIGSSRGMTNTYTQGIVTFFNREVDGVLHVQHDASITHGNSGGPLLNAYGEVIGINAWGYIDSQNLNFAVFVGELDNLSYGEEIPLSELYTANYGVTDALRDWLLRNYNASSETQARYDVYGENERHSLGYDSSQDLLYLDAAWRFEGGAELYVIIALTEGTSHYEYYARYTVGNYRNITKGKIAAASFTVDTVLTYLAFDGNHWDQESLLELYRSATVDLLSWFDVASTECEMGVTLDDLGFTAFERLPEEKSAYEVLCAHVVSKGIYDFDNAYYEIKQIEQDSEMAVVVGFVYDPEADYIFVSLGYLYSNGDSFAISLFFDNASGETYYVGQCDASGQTNTTFGLVVPEEFTSSTILTFEAYEGLDEQQADLLEMYSTCLKGLLEWMDWYFAEASLEITIADLGFTDYTAGESN